MKEWFKGVGCKVWRIKNVAEHNQPGFGHKIVILPVLHAVRALAAVANIGCRWQIRLAEGEQEAYHNFMRHMSPGLPTPTDEQGEEADWEHQGEENAWVDQGEEAEWEHQGEENEWGNQGEEEEAEWELQGEEHEWWNQGEEKQWESQGERVDLRPRQPMVARQAREPAGPPVQQEALQPYPPVSRPRRGAVEPHAPLAPVSRPRRGGDSGSSGGVREWVRGGVRAGNCRGRHGGVPADAPRQTIILNCGPSRRVGDTEYWNPSSDEAEEAENCLRWESDVFPGVGGMAPRVKPDFLPVQVQQPPNHYRQGKGEHGRQQRRSRSPQHWKKPAGGQKGEKG